LKHWIHGTTQLESLRDALAVEQAKEQTPVAWINWNAATGERSVSFECDSELASTPLYCTPPAPPNSVNGDVVDWESVAAQQAMDLALLRTHLEAEPVACPSCEALARAVMADQVSFDSRPPAYAVRQITDDDSVEQWVDLYTSPDVARENADAMASTGMGEQYEVVPMFTHPAPAQTPMSEDEIAELCEKWGNEDGDFITLYAGIKIARAVERHHGIGDKK
jgi:hypothetical protein